MTVFFRRSAALLFLLIAIEAGGGLLSESLLFTRRFSAGHLSTSVFTILALSLILAAAGVSAWRAWKSLNFAKQVWEVLLSSPQRVSLLLWVFGAVFMLSATALLNPGYRFGAWRDSLERAAPLIRLCALIGAQAVLFLLLNRTRNNHRSQLSIQKGALFSSGLFFLLLLSIFIWIGWTKIGVILSGRASWYSIGIPLLPGQVWLTGWLTIILSACWAFARRRLPVRTNVSHRLWRADLLIGLALWLLTAILWSSAPLPRNFFFPGPYAPDNAIYPYADSAVWDTGAQFALIGQGFSNSNAFQDHSGYMGILAFFHLLIGDNYARISALQAGLLAIFPALMYWLGKSLHSRPAGLFVAGLTILHELNAFAVSNMIDLSHARFLLTEYPTRVGLAIATLLLFRWLRAPQKGDSYALPIGGLLALMILLRFNSLMFPIAIIAGILLIYGARWKQGLRASLTIVVSLILVLSPWMWRSWVLSGNPFFFAEKTMRIFSDTYRFQPFTTPTPAPSSQESRQSHQLAFDAPPIRSKDSASATPSYSSASPKTESNSSPSYNIILSHFSHNVVASALVLPTNLLFHDIQRTIYEAHPYWGKSDGIWQGALTLQEALLLIANLLLISIGLGASWHRWRLAGFVPLGVYLTYIASLAAARTSGGRYIVPIDWIPLFYWSVGITQATLWGMTLLGVNIHQPRKSIAPVALSYKRGWLLLMPFLLFTSAMTITDRAISERYSELQKREVIAMIEENQALQEMDISTEALNAFIESKGALAYLGRGLYPRYYHIGKGESSSGIDAYEIEEYPRLAFTFIGQFNTKDVVLPWVAQSSVELHGIKFPNASDVIVLGCSRSSREKQYKNKYKNVIDALMVIIVGDDPEILMRNPTAPLKCPIPEPVCKNNQNCRQPP